MNQDEYETMKQTAAEICIEIFNNYHVGEIKGEPLIMQAYNVGEFLTNEEVTDE